MEFVGRMTIRQGEELALYIGRDADDHFDHLLLDFYSMGNFYERRKFTPEAAGQLVALLNAGLDQLD